MKNTANAALLCDVYRFQGEEITGALIYERLAKKCKDAHNAPVLADIASAEKRHFAFWKIISGQDVTSSWGWIMLFILLAQFLGLTFALQKGTLVAISGIITGIAAALSMVASNYLASKAEDDPKAKKAALYTG
jgi:hypothetical protein